MTMEGKVNKKINKKINKKKMKRNINPFYVISKKRGKEIEVAGNVFDATMKRLSLTPLWEVIVEILATLFNMAKSYGTIEVLIDFLNYILTLYRELAKLFRPVGQAS